MTTRALKALAEQLGAAILALQEASTEGAPSTRRGLHPASQDAEVRRAIEVLGDRIDGRAALHEWEALTSGAEHSSDRVWIHGDLMPSNLLTKPDGSLVAVLDFGSTGTGNRAVDAIPAWNLFNDEEREAFRRALNYDNETWVLGRAWALSMALQQLPTTKASTHGLPTTLAAPSTPS